MKNVGDGPQENKPRGSGTGFFELYSAPTAINPIDIVCFIDKVHVWFKRPLTEAQLTRLAKQCRGRLHVVEDRPAGFDPSYRQLVQLHYPKRRAFELLAARDDAHVNYLEVALDLIFANHTDAANAFAILDRLHVKRHHRNQRVAYAGEGCVTRYSGPRRAPNVAVAYADKLSKANDQPCCHLEWRIRGAAALRGAGIHSVADILKLRPRAFWIGRLLLYGLDVVRLGQLYHAHFRHKLGHNQRSTRWRIPLGRKGGFYDMDARAGGTITRALGSTQAVIDTYGRMFGSKLRERCLVSMDDNHLLPAWDISFD